MAMAVAERDTFPDNNKFRNVCFSANIPDGKTFADFPMDGLRTRLNPVFMIAQPEQGSHPHWQGYFQLEKQSTGKTIKNVFAKWGIKAHLECARGSAEKNIKYCSKDETCVDKTMRFSFGEPKAGQGARTDLEEMVTAMQENPRMTDLELLQMNARNYMVHNRAFGLVRQLLAPKRDWPTTLLVLWGPTGNGKTAQAMQLKPERVKYGGRRFFNGYTGQNEVVLFDEFNWKTMDLEQWLEMTDRYNCTVEIKGGFINWAPKTIIFTHNTDPATWYPSEEHGGNQHPAVTRRLEEFGTVMHFETKISHTTNTLKKYFAPAPPAYTKTATGISSAGPSGGHTAAPRRVVESTPESEETQPTQEVTFGEVITLDSDDDDGVGLIHEDSIGDHSEHEIELANLDGRIVPGKGKGKRPAED